MEDETSLTLPVARQILFNSFYLSQGSPGFQATLFEWVALQRPSWRLTGAVAHHLETLDASVTALIDAGLHKVPQHTSISAEIELQIRAFQRTLEQGPAPGDEARQATLLKGIGREMIRRDHYYYGLGRPRSQQARDHAPHPRRDPYFSYVCHSLLKRNRLGVRVFDELFCALQNEFASHGPIFNDIMADEVPRRQFIGLLASYNKTHPGAPVLFCVDAEQTF